MIRFSAANHKLRKLQKRTGKKVVSFDIRAGYNCPFAKDCQSFAVINGDGKRRIQDGKDTEYRCYSASQETTYPNLYNLRKHNETIINTPHSVAQEQLHNALPPNTEIVRVHSSGDFKTQKYFDMWMYFAYTHPQLIVYAYTKALPYWVNNLDLLEVTPNFVLTASYGGTHDHLIDQHNLRSTRVVYTESEANILGLPIDIDDSIAADPSRQHVNTALLIHGTQPKGSQAGKAVYKIKIAKRKRAKVL